MSAEFSVPVNPEIIQVQAEFVLSLLRPFIAGAAGASLLVLRKTYTSKDEVFEKDFSPENLQEVLDLIKPDIKKGFYIGAALGVVLEAIDLFEKVLK